MFGITAGREASRARHATAKHTKAQCLDAWQPVESASARNDNGHAVGAFELAPSRTGFQRRLVWRTHGTPPEPVEIAA